MKRKILFVGLVGESLPPPYSGIPKRALILARLWREWGHEVGLAFSYRHDNEDDLGAQGRYYFEFSTKPGYFLKFQFLIYWILKNPWLYMQFLIAGVRAYKTIRRDIILYAAYGIFIDSVFSSFVPDVIVAETALVKSFFAGLAARKRGIPFVVETYAEVHDRSMTKFASEQRRRHFWKSFFSLPDLVIAPSVYCACGPLEFLPKEKVHMVFATTLDVSAFTEVTESKIQARKQLSLPQESFLVLAVGAFTHRKGHDHIIAAAALLKEKGVEVNIVLCGADDPTWLENMAKELNISNQVHFFRRLSEKDLRLLFKAADIYCDASNTPRACLGIALTEALASRLPAVAYNAGGLPEVVEEGKNGYLVPINNINALAHAMGRMRNLPEKERVAMGEDGFLRAMHVFDVHVVARQVLSEVESVIKI